MFSSQNQILNFLDEYFKFKNSNFVLIRTSNKNKFGECDKNL